MGERNPSVASFVDEVGSYIRVMSEMPDPSHTDESSEPGWYAQSPLDATGYATAPWIWVSDVAVAYAHPALIMSFRWTGAATLTAPAGFYALIVDGTVLNAEKCTIRIEEFLTRKNWHERAQRAGNILVVSVPSPT